jgi:hypothetical protein
VHRTGKSVRRKNCKRAEKFECGHLSSPYHRPNTRAVTEQD